MKTTTDRKIIESVVSWRMVEHILPSREAFYVALESGHPLRFYWGADPTSPDLHLGHAANLFFLRDMQRLGHEIVVLVGDFTARIGDPTGRDTVRGVLQEADVQKNAETYRAQLGTLLDFKRKTNPAKIVFNSVWLKKLTAEDIVKVAGHFTVQQLIERDMFQRRLEKHNPIFLHEFLYPLIQGYFDPKALGADVQVGGSDQLFNMLFGHKLLQAEDKKKRFVATTRLLVNPKTGKKLMSKSEGNYISLASAPGDLFGKVMALPDEVLWDCLVLATDISSHEIEELKQEMHEGRKSPRELKNYLAKSVVGWVHSQNAAEEAEREFEKVFVKKEVPSTMKTVIVDAGSAVKLPEFLVVHGIASSMSAGRRLIEEGGVHEGDRVVREWQQPYRFTKNTVFKIGKRKFIRVEIRKTHKKNTA